ncbi:F-box only protein 16 isoform X8 [Chiroxiphia lanceolata]|uniref:F-box only protein 16 isoform X8 n=1 Tax=Chiroxiphia lanceolata TaxID=296741 RepID=UPI0013CE3F1C|nr:F-box only protein 16 isoform X8 [Chiroxiphia lanceolata]
MATGCGGEGGGGGGGGGDVRGRKEEATGADKRLPPTPASMAFAPPRNTDGSKLQIKMSTWTPLNHQLMNDRVFEERRALLGKWFDKWTDGQRRRILVDLLERCSLAQQKFCSRQLQDRIPTEAVDFTTRLPRVLSLYIFSFLDPRSLCRCAQVSWYWKYLSELDQLWMLKCLRFGWYINFCPTPFEQGIWKRHYIEMVRELWITVPKPLPKEEFAVIDVQPVGSDTPEAKLPVHGRRRTKEKKELPPWRSSDRHPTDTVRYNYLDNWDPIEQARQAYGSLQILSVFQSHQLVPAGPPIAPLGTCPPRQRQRPWPRAPSGTPGYDRHPSELQDQSHVGEGLEMSPGWRAELHVTSPVFEAQPWHIPASSQGSDSE